VSIWLVHELLAGPRSGLVAGLVTVVPLLAESGASTGV
jgi:hypothetical protein